MEDTEKKSAVIVENTRCYHTKLSGQVPHDFYIHTIWPELQTTLDIKDFLTS